MRSFEGASGGILLLFFLLCVTFIERVPLLSFSAENHAEKNIFVEVSGAVKYPGVYAFPTAPSLMGLLDRAGGLMPFERAFFPFKGTFSLKTGTRVTVAENFNRIEIKRDLMSAFYRITLGIPLCVNRESAEGLTAVPGIGRKTARAIVEMRNRSGGFNSLTELKGVRGIGPVIYEKISPFLTL